MYKIGSVIVFTALLVVILLNSASQDMSVCIKAAIGELVKVADDKFVCDYKPYINKDKIVWFSTPNDDKSKVGINYYDINNNTKGILVPKTNHHLTIIDDNVAFMTDNYMFFTDVISNTPGDHTMNPKYVSLLDFTQKDLLEDGNNCVQRINSHKNIAVYQKQKEENGKIGVYYMDLNKGSNEVSIDTGLYSSLCSYAPVISNGTIAYVHYNDVTKWDIYIYDTNSNINKPVASTSDWEYFPIVQNDYVYYMTRSGEERSINCYQISTGEKKTIEVYSEETRSLLVNNPDGDYLIYMLYQNNTYLLKAYNPNNSKIISIDNSTQGFITVGSSCYKNRLVYTKRTKDGNTFNYQICLSVINEEDLVESFMISPRDNKCKTACRIYDKNIVWDEYTIETDNIYDSDVMLYKLY